MIPVKTVLISKNPVYIFAIQLHSSANIAKHYQVEIIHTVLTTGQHKLTVTNNPPRNVRVYVYETLEEAKAKYEELIYSLEKQNFVLAEDFNKPDEVCTED